MEEKKKISVSTILLILAIIAMAVMGVFMYKLNKDKAAEIQKSTKLQSEVSSLNETVKDLQGKIDTISKTISSLNDSSVDEEELSEENIKTQFKIAWSIFQNSYDVFKYDENDSIDLPVEGQLYTWKYYKITNYDQIVNKYISSSYSNLLDDMEMVISDNNYYYIMDSAQENPLNKIDEVKNIEKSDDKISCIVTVEGHNYEFELVNENGIWKIGKFKR